MGRKDLEALLLQELRDALLRSRPPRAGGRRLRLVQLQYGRRPRAQRARGPALGRPARQLVRRAVRQALADPEEGGCGSARRGVAVVSGQALGDRFTEAIDLVAGGLV